MLSILVIFRSVFLNKLTRVVLLQKMESLPKDRILEFKPDTLTVIRKLYNLDEPGQMKEAVNILREWVQKQKHFKKKDFDPTYYEHCIITSKGSIERAKTQIDTICTMRTLLPQFFGNYNVKTDFGYLKEVAYTFALPKLTDDYYRIFIAKIYDISAIKSSQFIDSYRINTILSEYNKYHDYMAGFILILDYSEVNLIDFVSKSNFVEFKQAMTIYIANGMRIKAIHMISRSNVINTIVGVMKQVVSPKIGNRIYVHKNIEEVHKYVSKEILPKEFGGEERSLKELQDEWFDALSSEEHMKIVKEMNAAGSDESFRRKDDFNEQYAGMPGTFRVLSVD